MKSLSPKDITEMIGVVKDAEKPTLRDTLSWYFLNTWDATVPQWDFINLIDERVRWQEEALALEEKFRPNFLRDKIGSAFPPFPPRNRFEEAYLEVGLLTEDAILRGVGLPRSVIEGDDVSPSIEVESKE